MTSPILPVSLRDQHAAVRKVLLARFEAFVAGPENMALALLVQAAVAYASTDERLREEAPMRRPMPAAEAEWNGA